MTVFSKLNAARKEFHTLKLQKTGHNKFAGYNYFELGDFLIPALNTFDKHGLCAFVSFGEAVATMKIVDIDDGSFVELTSPMAEANLKGCHPIQNLGAVETYTRRYLWVAALEIVEHDAIDSSKPKEDTQPKEDAQLVAYETAHLKRMREHAMNGKSTLQLAFKALPFDAGIKTAFWDKHQKELKAAAAKAESLVEEMAGQA
jgi:hypothetical protein